MKYPFCPVCQKNVDDLVVYPHGVWIPDEYNTDKNQELKLVTIYVLDHEKN